MKSASVTLMALGFVLVSEKAYSSSYMTCITDGEKLIYTNLVCPEGSKSKYRARTDQGDKTNEAIEKPSNATEEKGKKLTIVDGNQQKGNSKDDIGIKLTIQCQKMCDTLYDNCRNSSQETIDKMSCDVERQRCYIKCD